MLADAGRGWVWSGGAGGAAVAFAGRGAAPAAGPSRVGEPAHSVPPSSPSLASLPSRDRLLARIAGKKLPVAWARQVHSARVLAARAGECGEGDALVGRDRGLALSVVTADCVPVLLAGPAGIAAAHAGWRGIAAGIVPATVATLGGEAGETVAWIGPAIGPCCYEVGPEVAAQVAAASDPDVVEMNSTGRPHLDLQEAVRLQLRAAGLRHLHILRLCTRCQDFRLHSYRREGKAAGRNHSFIWMT
jgi:YfiH family protein